MSEEEYKRELETLEDENDSIDLGSDMPSDFEGSEIDSDCFHPDDDEISSEDEIDLDNLDSYLSVIQENPIDSDMISSLVDILERHQYYRLAYQVSKIGLELDPYNQDLSEANNRLPPEDNSTLLNLLKNNWFTPQKYKYNQVLKVQQMNQENPALDLEGSLKQPHKIPSFPDTVALIPADQEYYIFRTFHLEKYQMYLLRCRCGSSPQLETFLHVSTSDDTVRLNHKLSRSVIQYKFNSLNQETINVGLKGENKRGFGQLRLIEMSLEKVDQPDLSSFSIRTLSPKFPVIANFVIEKEHVPGLNELIQSINPYFDQINFYLNNWNVGIPDILRHPKIKLMKGNLGRCGLFQLCKQRVGYHFMLSPHYIYQEDFVPLMLSKIQQYEYKVVVGLRGIQIDSQKFETYKKSRKEIPVTLSINQDIKCHLLGLDAIAFFSGGFECHPNKFKNSDLAEVQLAIMGQEQEVSFICVERIQSLVTVNSKTNEAKETESSDIDKIIKNQKWKFF